MALKGAKMTTYSVRNFSRREILKVSAVFAGSGVLPLTGSAGAVQPDGQLTWAVHFTLAPTLFEPAETPGLITPFMILYALHDAMLKPMPGNSMAPSLAESWNTSSDGLVYEFVLRNGARFHNGDGVVAEDVKFSFCDTAVTRQSCSRSKWRQSTLRILPASASGSNSHGPTS
jgi:peptide/nickel transport system substrate-binding protein